MNKPVLRFALRGFLIGAVLSVLTACGKTEPALKMPVANADVFGKAAIELRDVKGKYIFFNFWAEWCKPCIEEIPELNAFYEGHKDKVLMIGINFDRLQGEKLIQAQKKAGIKFPVLTKQPDFYFALPAVQALPTTLVFNGEGELLETLMGPQTETTLMKVMN